MSRGHLAHEKSFINLWNAAAMCLEWHVNEFKWLKLKKKKTEFKGVCLAKSLVCMPHFGKILHTPTMESGLLFFAFPTNCLKKLG